MNELRDIPLEFGFNPVSATGGIWTGISAYDAVNQGDPNLNNFYIFPLSPNFLRPDYVPYASFYTNGTPYGPLNRLDANRFTRISFRMSLPQGDRSSVSIFWAKTFNQWPAAEANLVTWYDGEPSFNGGGQYVQIPQSSGFRIYDIDPNQTQIPNEQNAFLTTPLNLSGGGWDSEVYSFFIWPSNLAKASDAVSVSFDWIRVYDPDLSPEVVLNWNSSGLGTAEDSIQLFVDTDASGFDGDLMVAGLKNDGSYSLKTAALPPGDYYFYLKGIRHENSALLERAVSNYSAKVTIGSPPLLTVTSPSYESGVDFATTELGNPWDFNDASDVFMTSQMNSISYNSGVFSAVTDPPVYPYPESDDQIWLNMKKNGQNIAVDSTKYRYLSFRMKVQEEPGYSDIFDKVRRGWESRVLWWTQGVTIDGSYSKDVPLLEEWRTYSVDLWDNNFLEEQSAIPEVPQMGWEEVGQVGQLRFDPMEAHIPTRFWIDYIKLTAENRPINGVFPISWNIEDADSSNFELKIFADLQMSNGGIQRSETPIATLSVGVGAGTWEWSPGKLYGNYFIRMEIEDQGLTRSVTSRVAVNTKVEPTGTTIPVPGDYDGDGIDDVVVYQPSSGEWFIYPMSNEGPLFLQWGDASMIPVPGDYDGDGAFDLALYQQTTGQWYIRSLNDGPPITFGQNWGDAGMDPVSGDFNGDGVYDLAVYQRQTGNWYIRSLGAIGPGNPPITFGQNWGDAGMAPVSGDFNGDGVYDLAVYQRQSGNWFIRSLGPIGPSNPPITFGQNWGGPDMDPVSGDYNGDGVSDLTAYQRGTGNWFSRSLGPVGPGYPPLTFGQNWGDASMTPVPGDYNGDGGNDLAVYQFTTGNWFVRALGDGPPLLFGFKWGQ
ncbi:VCBS repeat-containing protein [Kiritimatiellaeota bacterium B1221]|nr:VCBS repeat-containing protein [Kiritimatiellaeota bacterium B1221]